MSGKLDQSLDDILKDRRQSVRRPRGGRRVPNAGRRSTVAKAPVGGVKKIVKSIKAPGKPNVPTGPSGSVESKIIVSNLPADVTEQQIKEYFSKTVGPAKKVSLTYGPNGQSRGISTIVFSKSGSAAEAAKSLDGVKVDGRPMKIEVVVGAKEAPAPPPVKGLGDRIAQPKTATKAQPKPATSTKNGGGRIRGRRSARGRNAGRGKPKSVEELDAEMQDYYETGANATAGEGDAVMETNGGAVQPAPAAAGGDTGMDDEVL